MVLAVGTGMNAAVIAPDGTEWAFGYYANFGGAATIVHEVFNAVLRAEDGRGQPTLLTQMILNHLGQPTVEALLRASISRQLDYGKFYAFAPLVFEAALKGDHIAVEILVHQGRELAEYATAMARRFNMCEIEFDIVLAGSVFKGVGPLLIDTITQEIHQVAPRARIVRAHFEPVIGSVLLAYDALDIEVTDDIYARLAETTPDAKLFDTSRSFRTTPIRNEDK
jgi:N-acetylglucosamine kinase-like BadF-type ATPase